MGVKEKREMKVNVEKDYRNMDITRGTNKEDAIRATEARGFRIVREVKKPVAVHDKYLSRIVGEELGSSIVMYNDETGAILTASSVIENDFCNGGCSIRFVMNNNILSELPEERDHAIVHSIGGDWNEYFIPQVALKNEKDGFLAYYDKISDYIKSCKEKIDNGALDNIPECTFGFLSYIDTIRVKEDRMEDFYNLPISREDMFLIYFNHAINLILEKFDPEVINSDCPAFDKIKDEKEFSELFCNNIGLYKNSSNAGDLSNRVILLKTAFNYLQMPEQEQNIILDAVRSRLREWDKSIEDIAKLINGETPINPENTFVGKFNKQIENPVLYGRNGETMTTDEILDCLNMTDITAVDVKLPWDVSVRENQNEIEKE